MPFSTRGKQWGTQQADHGALQGDRLSKTVPHTASWIKKKITSYVGPTHKASWEQEPCATVINSLLDPKDTSEDRRKEKGHQVILVATRQASISTSCPSACPVLPSSSTGQVWDCFSTGQLCIKLAPSPRPHMKKDPTFLMLVCNKKERAHSIIQLSITLWICLVTFP